VYSIKSRCQRHDCLPTHKYKKISVVFPGYIFWAFIIVKLPEIALLQFVYIFHAKLTEWTYLRGLCPSVHQPVCCVFKNGEGTMFYLELGVNTRSLQVRFSINPVLCESQIVLYKYLKNDSLYEKLEQDICNIQIKRFVVCNEWLCKNNCIFAINECESQWRAKLFINTPWRHVGDEGISLHIIIFSTRWEWVVSCMLIM